MYDDMIYGLGHFLTFTGCFPFFENDPFVLEQSPNILIVGNQPDFASTRITSTIAATEFSLMATVGEVGSDMVHIVLVPKFSDTCTAVLLDTRNLQCNTVKFT